MKQKKSERKQRIQTVISAEARDRQLLHGLAVKPADGRKASSALYVMLAPDQKARYEKAAASAGMSMREYVVNALEAQLALQTIDAAPSAQSELFPPTAPDAQTIEWMMRRLNAHSLKLGAVEKQLDALQKRVETDLGPQFPPRHWFDEDGNLKKP